MLTLRQHCTVLALAIWAFDSGLCLVGRPATTTAALPSRQFAENFSADSPSPDVVGATSARKGPGGPWKYGEYTYYCGVFHTGRASRISAGAVELQEANQVFFVPTGSCRRVYCRDTSAIYVCNDGDTGLGGDDGNGLPGYYIGWMAGRLAELCCDSRHGMSAQLFHPTQHWNTVVGYGNCRHPEDEAPASFGGGNGGVNGDCVPNEGWDEGEQKW